MKYDYIFAGVGLAGLLILHEMMISKVLEGKKILLLDPDEKVNNDRTWCFWEETKGDWDNIVSKRWKRAVFVNNEKTITCISEGKNYKMIESLSFYEQIIGQLKSYPEIIWKKEKMLSFEEKTSEVVVITEKSIDTASVLFNSVFDYKKIQNNREYPLLQQHFIGWFVRTATPVFDADCATFMDFSVAQKGNTRFMYVLPISSTEALVEYTLFSATLLEEKEYEIALEDYLIDKGITDFEIIKKEKGIIPMTAYPFWKENSTRVLHIGTAGGWTKASTGFTFKNSVKQSKRVISFLQKEKINFRNFYKTDRFSFYDSLFIAVLYKNNALGYALFSRMFSNIKPEIVFRFLDEKSKLIEDVKVILSCPKGPFIKALFAKLMKF
ncbi:MAG: lycopene cyclase family protein [Flavobacterium sp.]